MWWHIQNTERKENCQLRILYPEKAAFQKWKRDKDFSKQTKAEGIHYYETHLTKNAKGSSLSGNKGHQLTS